MTAVAYERLLTNLLVLDALPAWTSNHLVPLVRAPKRYLVVEVAAQDVVAIEIKATSAPSRDDARHLMWLRDQLGERFLAGAVLHTGPRPFQLADRVLALPICCLWG